MTKRLLIVRGLPGAGKSQFIENMTVDILTKVVCSADDYFMVQGKYCFDAKALPQAHQQCKEHAERAMKQGMCLVVIDNTCSRRWEIEPYLTLAQQYGYDITEVTVGRLTPEVIGSYFRRNNHGVPEETIRKMVEQWEF